MGSGNKLSRRDFLYRSAQVSAVAGYRVVIQDITKDALDRSKEIIEKSLARFASKGKIQEPDMFSALGRIHYTTQLEEALV